MISDGYINESGTIEMPRLQLLLNELKGWECEIFEKVHADTNWFKGKQRKHDHDAETTHTDLGWSLSMTALLWTFTVEFLSQC